METETKDVIRNLIQAIENGDAMEIENNFNEIMAQKVKSALDYYSVEIAKSMFKDPDIKDLE